MLNKFFKLLRGAEVKKNKKPSRLCSFRPELESFEERITPTTNIIYANGLLTGSVIIDGGTKGVSGVTIGITGETTTGRSVNYSIVTNSNGNFSIDQLLPGSYNVTRSTPAGFLSGTTATSAQLNIAEGQSITQNLGLGGLTPAKVSLGLWASGVNTGVTAPTAGSGTATGFTMTQIKAFTDSTVAKNSTSDYNLAAYNLSLAKNSTSYYNLAAYNLSPDTTDTTITFNTSKGAIDVTLMDTASPVSVTNFLSYAKNGSYTDDLFHRMANLSGTGAPQILQGGQFTTNSSGSPSTVSSFTDVPTYQPIANEYDPSRPNKIGSLAMARTSDLNSATSQFYFNLTDNTTSLGQTGNGYAAFGNVANSASLTNLQSFATSYTPQAGTIITTTTNPVPSLPALTGASPAVTNNPVGTATTNLALTNTITGATPTGYLNYLVSSSDPSIVTATIGSLNGTFSPSQVKLVAGGNVGTAVITVTLIDNRNEATIKTFNVTVQ
ncbi:MAG: peptidylprolyl isomerase [Planctomycetota bacterium]|nr:peptidylprolyl isomerase [Planctomycetota bacterium]